ncbi:MAG TPA: hypothetical protein PKD09_17800 [Aggregatilinea sp.]|uniref:hypothetical protein n=1 Tax=Aggregatilinea sp. TaxID=2806333 RepID=UPI002CF1A458|nr:hypothetical protein [Aggregatilinea sp.]HML23515.1 hypothetical protein [Aggregatilinea sp.]
MTYPFANEPKNDKRALPETPPPPSRDSGADWKQVAAPRRDDFDPTYLLCAIAFVESVLLILIGLGVIS